LIILQLDAFLLLNTGSPPAVLSLDLAIADVGLLGHYFNSLILLS
jgi:hypothetical protein